MDTINVERRSSNMRAIKSKNTHPEMVVRKIVHAMGYRFRLYRKDLPGKPDLTFALRRKVIFIHGCFWHQHNQSQCRRGSIPKSNSDYWIPKLARNVRRDCENEQKLVLAGWRVMVVWECEIQNDMNQLREKLVKFLST